MANYNEKRGALRKSYKSSIIVGEIEDNYIYRATLANYSKHGICFKSDVFFKNGTEISIGIDSVKNSSAKSLKCYRGKILWSKELSEIFFRYLYGVKIISTIEKRFSKDIHFQKKESRKHLRKDYPKPVFFASQNQYYRGFIKNINKNSAFIQTKEKFILGQIFMLAIPRTQNYKTIMLKAEIVNICKTGIRVEFKSFL